MRRLWLTCVLVALALVGILLYLSASGTWSRPLREREAIEDPTGPGRRAVPAPETPPGVSLTVLKPGGDPAARARVLFTGPEEVATAADADGFVLVEKLRPGHYSVLARLGGASGALSFQCNGSKDLGSIRMRFTGAIRGTVRDAFEKPLEGAMVEAVRTALRPGLEFDRVDPVVARAQTDAGGRYELRAPRGSTYGVRCWLEGHGHDVESGLALEGDIEAMNFRLAPGARVRGCVVDEQGAPVERAQVMLGDSPKLLTLTGADGTFELDVAGPAVMTLSVRAAGHARYTLTELELPADGLFVPLQVGRKLEVRTNRPGVSVFAHHRGWSGEGVTGPDGALLLAHFPWQPGEHRKVEHLVLSGKEIEPRHLKRLDLALVEGVLRTRPIVLEAGCTVRGRVRNAATNRPIAGALLHPVGRYEESLVYLRPVCRSDGRGEFFMVGLPRLTTRVLGSAAGYVAEFNFWRHTHPVSHLMREEHERPPLFTDEQRTAIHDVSLYREAVLSGKVLAPDGRPVAGARVAYTDRPRSSGKPASGLGRPVFTDVQGEFRLRGLRPGERVWLLATHRTFGRSAETRVAAGPPVAFLDLRPPRRLEGKVTGDRGLALPGVRVFAEGHEVVHYALGPLAQGRAWGLTGEDGRYVIPNAPRGGLELTFTHRHHLVARGSHEKPDAALEPGLPIAGTVVDGENRPVARAAVVIENDAHRRAARTDESGRFRIPAPRGEIFTLHVGHLLLRKRVEGVPAGRTELAVRLDR